MGLHELTLRHFRLFPALTLRPDPESVTVLLSPNGTGKTSVLEAVNMLATASSFRTASASDVIRTGENLAEVHGVIYQQQRRIQVDLTLSRGVRNTTKRMLVNGQKPSSRADIAAVLPLTVFTPEGVDIVRQGPDHRRHFLTTLLTDVDLTTGDLIERFARVLTQRNAFLRGLEGQLPSAHQRVELDIWDQDFAAVADVLIAERIALVEQLSPLVSRFYTELARAEQHVELRYEQSWTGALAPALHQALRDDVYRGYCTIGPQRDDVAILLNGRDARRQASQGEQRSLALALRLAGHQLVKERRGIDPLLLLDDVFSELDPVRSDALLGLLPVGQTLVTTASPLPPTMSPAVIIDVTKELG